MAAITKCHSLWKHKDIFMNQSIQKNSFSTKRLGSVFHNLDNKNDHCQHGVVPVLHVKCNYPFNHFRSCSRLCSAAQYVFINFFRHIYWTDSGTNRIEVAKLDGRYRKWLIHTDLDQPAAIVVNPSLGYEAVELKKYIVRVLHCFVQCQGQYFVSDYYV